MIAPRPALRVALLLLVPLWANAGAVIREPGAIYLEDFVPAPITIATLADTPIYYKADLGRYLGTIRKGQTVELQAIGENILRIRGKAQQGQVAGWVSTETLTALKPEFIANLRQNAARKTDVDALIAKGEVAVNMTIDEVTAALGKPSRTTSRLDARGREEIWEFVRYIRVPQEVTGYDRRGRAFSSITYVKVPNGKLAVTFLENLVSTLEQTEGTLDRDTRTKIVAVPGTIGF